MPFDPYFASNGARALTCFSEPRAKYTKAEIAECDRLLSLPDDERIMALSHIKDKLFGHRKITRAEMRFYHTMRRRSRVRSRLPLRMDKLPRRTL
jgi:hypothetical protein